jgi:diacylglycerol kinase (ATP)
MPLPIVITNPASASGATGASWPAIASDLRTHFGPFTVAFTKQRGDSMALAAEAARKGTKLIIACGGDGTISEAANGILNSGKDAELGILPSGTGGDFRRTLGIPSRAREAAEILRHGKTRLIDVGRITFIANRGQQETRHFLGVASFGMSADIVDRVKRGGPNWVSRSGFKWLSGRVSFGVSMLQTAMEATPARVIVQFDDEHERHLTVANLCVANARYFGGGMKIAPDAKLNDGRFDVVSIGDLGALKILTNAPRLYAGTHLSMNDVSHALVRKVVARTADKDAEIQLEVDGELPGRLPATFQIVPGALRVRCPE